MKMFALVFVLALIGCRVEGKIVPSEGPVAVEKIGEADGCSIYRFYDGETIHFVRCGLDTTTTKQVSCGKGCVREEAIQTIVRPECSPALAK